MHHKKNNPLLVIVAAIVAVLIVLAGVYAFLAGRQSTNSGYKAVFLINGQVYFGKVVNERSNPIVLRDVYYPQLQASGGSASPAPTPAAQLQLVKMGNEPHGPKDEIRFNKDQVLYIEDLKDDGQVVRSIKQFQAQ